MTNSNCSACGCRPQVYINSRNKMFMVSCYANDATAIEDGDAYDWCPEERETGWHKEEKDAWDEWERINPANQKSTSPAK